MASPKQVIMRIGRRGSRQAGKDARMGILERHWNTAISSPHPAESYCGIRALLAVARIFQSFRKQRVKNKKISDLNLLGYKKYLPWKWVSIFFIF
jgi:hypothetical protein